MVLGYKMILKIQGEKQPSNLPVLGIPLAQRHLCVYMNKQILVEIRPSYTFHWHFSCQVYTELSGT